MQQRLIFNIYRLYEAVKFICSALWALSQTQMTGFLTLIYTSRSEIPILSFS